MFVCKVAWGSGLNNKSPMMREINGVCLHGTQSQRKGEKKMVSRFQAIPYTVGTFSLVGIRFRLSSKEHF